MSASSRYEISSGNPDKPFHASGQHGSYPAAALDRSSSFHESTENPIVSSLPNMTRNSIVATQADALSFLQCLRFDPKSMIGDHKLNRTVNFKRLASSALGIPGEVSVSLSSKGKPLASPSPEDFRRLKAGLRESCSKARERVKVFNESLSVINKWFPSIPLKKRSRLDALSNGRSNALFPNDRSVSGMCIRKMRAQSHVSTSGFELELPKTEERTNFSIPNKRTRTSMVDSRPGIRASTPVRSLMNTKKDKGTLRIPNSSAGQGENQTLSTGVESWEKTKMKKKRSGIKQDVSSNSAAAKPNNCCSNPKQGLHQRLLTDTRPRSSDTHGFRVLESSICRPGGANGGIGIGTADGTLQQTGMRSSISNADVHSTTLHDRRDVHSGSEKKRMNFKAVNKASAREDLSSGSPTSSTKTARVRRLGSGLIPKLPPVIRRATGATDWELSHCTSEHPASSSVINRKRMLPAQSSSPPVAQWAGQRPQKISRAARRTNILPMVPSSDETPTSDSTSDIMCSERRLSINSPQQVKLKFDNLSSALSESEESGAAEAKSKQKNKKTDEIDEKDGMHVQKMSTLLLPPRKSKFVNGEGHRDGIRRQGRTGQTSGSSRSLMKVEKLCNAGTSKQLRSLGVGIDKNESKAGRPPTRKLSDRKAYSRQKHTTTNTAANFLDDGLEELLTVAKAVTNPAQALSSLFWKKMEPYFCYISDIDLVYLKQQINLMDMSTSSPLTPDDDTYGLISNGFRLSEVSRNETKAEDDELKPELSSGRTLKQIPLYQRLIAALIPEEGNEEVCHDGNEDIMLDTFRSGFDHEEDVEVETLCALQSANLSGRMAYNGDRSSTYGRSMNELDLMMANNSFLFLPETGIIPKCNQAVSDHSLIPSFACSGNQYSNMSISERLLLEIQSVEIYPDHMPSLSQPEDDEIARDIIRLHEKYHRQVIKKKGFLGKLLDCATKTKELQEKEFERQALDKLLVMAYEKYMSASGKMAKQAALAFVRRTLERFRELELTGKSCFGEPVYRDIFFSGTSHLNDGLPRGSTVDVDSGIHHVSTSECSAEIRAPASLGMLHSPSSEVLLSANPSSDDSTGKDHSWSNRVEKRKLLLDDVGGGVIGASSGAPLGIGSYFPTSAKGKRSERDREGKGSSREVLSRSETTKIGLPASANVKEERKSKSKPKQKATQLSASNGLLGKKADQTKSNLPPVPKSNEMNSSGIAKDNLGVLDDPIDLSGLQLPEMDDLGVPDDFGGQGQDIGSWLNFDDDGMQDDDFMGLEIPMDDLSDLNMMV